MNLDLLILERFGFYRPLDYDHRRFARLAKRCGSPIEKAFWSTGYFELSKLGELIPQLEVYGYRLDFALIRSGVKIAIELDGHDYHKTKKQRQADYQRERTLQLQGWHIIRFTGSDIYRDTQECIKQVIGIARGAM